MNTYRQTSRLPGRRIHPSQGLGLVGKHRTECRGQTCLLRARFELTIPALGLSKSILIWDRVAIGV